MTVDDVSESSVPVDPTGGYWNPTSTYNAKYPVDSTLLAFVKQGFPGYDWMIAPGMAKYVRGALDYIGAGVPGGCNLSCDKWADRAAAYKFMIAVKYFQQFDYKYNYSTGDCVNMQNVLAAIDNEVINIQQQRVAGTLGVGETGVGVAVLGDMKSKITTAMSNLNCTQVLNDMNQSSFLGTVQDQIAAAGATDDASNATTKYIIWGMLGVVVIVSLVIVFKKKST